MVRAIKIIFFITNLFLLGCNRVLDPVSSVTLSKEALSDQEVVSELYTLQRDYIQKLNLLGNNLAEAKSLQTSYSESIRNTLPDLNNAVSLTGVEQLDHNTLLLEQDMLLPLDTFKGAMELLMLDALASGRDVEQLQHIIAEEAAKDTLQDRAIYGKNVSKWSFSNGKYRIPYHFSSELNSADTKLYKRKTREAMQIWEAASKNKIKFFKINYNIFYILTRRLKINFKKNGSDRILGNATIGSYLDSQLSLFKSTIGSDEKLLLAAALHELGHTLGFRHEHQRGDRNVFVNVNSGNSVDYGLLPLYGKFDRWMIKSFTRPNGSTLTIDIPPATNALNRATSPYDYLSIMHYSGLVVKVAKQGYRVGERVAFNYVLSDEDKKGVRLLYPPL